MKYGNLVWPGTTTEKNGTLKINLGDILQFLAVEYLLKRKGINEEEIVKLRMEEISSYRGEKIVLFLNWALFDTNFMKEDKFNISPDIRLVYLAATINSVMFKESYFNAFNIEYLKSIEPIGCRDEKTAEILQKYGIKAYVNGCMTSLLPRREYKNAKKVFFVDAPIELRSYIPEKYLDNCEFVSQQIYLQHERLDDVEEIWNDVKKHYERIFQEASMVVTSRLHVASPCMALGIPVIMAKRQIDYRFDWLEKMIPLYDQNQYGEIDWNVQSIEYEDYKEKKIAELIEIINGTRVDVNTVHRIPIINEKYEQRIFCDFRKCLHGNFDDVLLYMKNIAKKETFLYSIWGITSGAEEFCKKVEAEIPNTQLVHVYDKYRLGEWNGMQVECPSIQNMKEDNFVAVLSVGAIPEAKSIFNQVGKLQTQYYFVGDTFLEKSDVEK